MVVGNLATRYSHRGSLLLLGCPKRGRRRVDQRSVRSTFTPAGLHAACLRILLIAAAVLAGSPVSRVSPEAPRIKTARAQPTKPAATGQMTHMSSSPIAMGGSRRFMGSKVALTNDPPRRFVKRPRTGFGPRGDVAETAGGLTMKPFGERTRTRARKWDSPTLRRHRANPCGPRRRRGTKSTEGFRRAAVLTVPRQCGGDLALPEPASPGVLRTCQPCPNFPESCWSTMIAHFWS